MLKTKEILGNDISSINDRNLKKVKERVKNNEVSWILGAGVSKDVGVPLWGECLQRMWARMLFIDRNFEEDLAKGMEFRKTLREMFKSNELPEIFLEKADHVILGKKSCDIFGKTDPLEAAEYIQNLVKEAICIGGKREKDWETAFLCLVKECLKLSKTPDDVFREMSNRTLKILANHIKNQVNCEQSVSVITYNFDNLLEFALERVGLKKENCYIKNPGISSVLEDHKGVHIYHPHGTVSVIEDSISEESDRLVLAQSNYERLGQKAYVWENSVQAKALHDSSCVFLGFSGDDANFRRIIKNSETIEDGVGAEHFLFISIESAVKNLFSETVDPELPDDEYNKALSSALANDENCFERMMFVKRIYAQYLYWGKYNIIPIWTTRNELPDMIKKICGM